MFWLLPISSKISTLLYLFPYIILSFLLLQINCPYSYLVEISLLKSSRPHPLKNITPGPDLVLPITSHPWVFKPVCIFLELHHQCFFQSVICSSLDLISSRFQTPATKTPTLDPFWFGIFRIFSIINFFSMDFNFSYFSNSLRLLLLLAGIPYSTSSSVKLGHLN